MLTDGLGVHGGIFSDGLGGVLGKIASAVKRAVGGGGRKRRKRISAPGAFWYDRRTEEDDLEEQLRAAIARDTQAFERERDALIEKTGMLFAKEAIDEQIAEEQRDRESKHKQRERAFFALEMGKASDIRAVSDEGALRNNAKRRAAAALKENEAESARQLSIKRQRLVNLEKARVAKEKKAAKKEKIKQDRLKNLKKARAAKRRKAKGKK